MSPKKKKKNKESVPAGREARAKITVFLSLNVKISDDFVAVAVLIVQDPLPFFSSDCFENGELVLKHNYFVSVCRHKTPQFSEAEFSL